jgi:hypothetical protein
VVLLDASARPAWFVLGQLAGFRLGALAGEARAAAAAIFMV